MDTVATLAAVALSTPKRDLSKAMPPHYVEKIFMRLTAQLGTKMAGLFAGASPDAVKQEWSEGLAGYVTEEIVRGLTASQSLRFAPTLGEFKHLCRPALDAEIAWIEACTCMKQREAGEVGDWTHPAVYRAAREFGYELKARTYKECAKAWKHTLDREFLNGWGEVPAPALRLQHSPTGRPPTIEVLEKLAKLRAEITNKKTQLPIDKVQ